MKTIERCSNYSVEGINKKPKIRTEDQNRPIKLKRPLPRFSEEW
jgi:hypothetical protein